MLLSLCALFIHLLYNCLDLCCTKLLLQTEHSVWVQLAFCNQAALTGPLMHFAQLRSVWLFHLVYTDGSGQVLRLLLCSSVTESSNIAFVLAIRVHFGVHLGV